MLDVLSLPAGKNKLVAPNPLTRIYGLFKKEFALQVGSGLALVNRLFVGPVIGLATTGILYSSFFRLHPSSSLGVLSGDNYLIYVGFGFLMHTYLNAGYYCLAPKVMGESFFGTLQLLWISPCNRVTALLSLTSMEVLKCLVVLVVAMIIAGQPHGPWWEAAALQLVFLFLFLPICLLVGALRAMVTMINSDLADFLDHGYLLFMLTACPYIPRELLPSVLRPLCEINPAYHMGHLMRGAWNHDFWNGNHILPLISITVLLLAMVYSLWVRYRHRIYESCFN